MIRQYLGRLARELDFDPALARQVEREVEDHLWEAVESDPAADGQEAERRAVAKFGDARAIAAQFAVLSVATLARRVGLAGVLLISAVFIAMKARVAWYAVVPCPLAEETKAGRFSLLCAAATAALVVCVAADGVLTLLRLTGAQWSSALLVPLLSMAIEIACAGVLVSSLRAMVRRAAHTARLAAA